MLKSFSSIISVISRFVDVFFCFQFHHNNKFSLINFRKWNNCVRRSRKSTSNCELSKGLAWAQCRAFPCRVAPIALIATTTIHVQTEARREAVADPTEDATAWGRPLAIHVTAIVVDMSEATTQKRSFIAAVVTVTATNFKADAARTARPPEIIRN